MRSDASEQPIETASYFLPVAVLEAPNLLQDQAIVDGEQFHANDRPFREAGLLVIDGDIARPDRFFGFRYLCEQRVACIPVELQVAEHYRGPAFRQRGVCKGERDHDYIPWFTGHGRPLHPQENSIPLREW